MAAELVETSRLWARTVARIEPEWVEPLARHLVRHSYSEPHWEKKAATVMAIETKLAEASMYFYLGRIGHATSAQVKAQFDQQSKTITDRAIWPVFISVKDKDKAPLLAASRRLVAQGFREMWSRRRLARCP